MDIWENRVITYKGLALQAKLIAGNSLTITRAVTGTGYVMPALLKEQTAVSGEKQTLEFRNVTYPETGKCSLPCHLTNSGLTEGYTACQVGIYATDPDEGEILYAITQANAGDGTVVPSETDSPGYIAEWVFYFQFGQADSVEVDVNPAYTVTIGMLEEDLAAERRITNQALDLKANAIHGHGVSDVTGLQDALNGKALVDLTNVENANFAKKAMEAKVGNINIMTSGTGSAYTAEIPGVTELYIGLTFNIIPHTVSTTTGPTLNVNNLGEKNLRQRLSTNTGSFSTGSIDSWLSALKPVSVTYDGSRWLVNHARPSSASIYGTMPVEKGGTGAPDAATARANLGIDTALAGKSDTGHTHDDRYYTESEMDTKLGGKSDTGHTHDDRYYTESEMDTKLGGKSDTGHTHTKSQITDFPSSMPASDVYSWAKQSSKPSYTYSEVGAAPSSHTHDDRYYTESEIDTKLSGKAASSHTHTKSQITDFPTSMPASDVYAWAKASSKPSYAWSEITGKPSSYTPSSHNHYDFGGSYDGNGGKRAPNHVGTHNNQFHMGNEAGDGYQDWLHMNNYTWSDVPYATMIGVTKSSTPSAYIASGGNSSSTSAWTIYKLLDSNNFTSYAPTKTGSGASGTWGINISGKASTAGTADSANSVAWGNVSGRPSSMPANGGNADTVDSQHFTYSNSSNSPTYLWGTNSSGSNFLAHRASISVNYANSAGSAPASDVYAWAKASSKPSYSHSEVGAAPAYTYGTTDLTAGSSSLATGTLYFVYE